MALSTIKLSTQMKENFKTEVDCSKHFVIDQPKAMGGQDLGPNPLEVFLASLPACICAIGRIIANQRRIQLNGIEVDVEADIDKDFLLGKTEEGRAGFTEIRVFVEIDADLTQQEKEDLMADITKRCPIADNIIHTSSISSIVK